MAHYEGNFVKQVKLIFVELLSLSFNSSSNKGIKCEMSDCSFVQLDRSFFRGKLIQQDKIFFHGRNIPRLMRRIPINDRPILNTGYWYQSDYIILVSVRKVGTFDYRYRYGDIGIVIGDIS